MFFLDLNFLGHYNLNFLLLLVGAQIGGIHHFYVGDGDVPRRLFAEEIVVGLQHGSRLLLLLVKTIVDRFVAEEIQRVALRSTAAVVL